MDKQKKDTALPERIRPQNKLREALQIFGVALSKNQKSNRLFFALWPSPELQQQFFAAGKLLHGECGGRRTACDSIHLTLAFLGDVPQSRLADIQECACQIMADGFILDFDQLGWWRHNQVAWAGCSQAAPGLLELVQSLQTGLETLGFAGEKRAYAPHVTLLRKAMCPTPVAAHADIVWSVADFVLVKSELSREGPRYEILQRFPLRSLNQR